MAITRTAPLPVEEVAHQDNITLVLSMAAPLPSPLFIGSITVTSGSALSGSFVPGTASHPGNATLNVGGALFNTLLQTALPFKVVLTYDSVRRTISNLNVVVDAALAS